MNAKQLAQSPFDGTGESQRLCRGTKNMKIYEADDGDVVCCASEGTPLY